MRRAALGLGMLVVVVALAVSLWLASNGREGASPRTAPVTAARSPGGAVAEGRTPPAVPAALEASPLPPAASAPSAAAPWSPPPGTPAARLTGRVLDAHGAPVGGAEVSGVPTEATLVALGAPASRSERALDLTTLPRTSTAADGTFVLDLPHTRQPVFDGPMPQWPDVPEVVVRAVGFAIRSLPLPAFRGGAYEVGDVVLQAGGTFSGRVVGEAGEPLDGVAVAVLVRNIRRAVDGAIHGGLVERWLTGVTGPDGRFAVAGVPPCDVGVALTREGFVALERHGFPLATGAHVDAGDLRLLRGATLEVLVRDGAGRPLAGAEVFAAPEDMRRRLEGFEGDLLAVEWDLARAEALASATSDADGRLALSALGRDEVTLYGSAAGHALGRLPDVRTSAGVPAVLVLPPAARLLVRVVDAASGEPLAGARVEARSAVGFAGLPPLPVSGPGEDGPEGPLPAGEHLVTGISATANELRVEAPGRAPWRAVVGGAEPGGLLAVTAELHAGATLTGRLVTPDGAPHADTPLAASLQQHGEEWLPDLAAGRTGDDGRFALAPLQPGAWRVLVGFREKVPGTLPVAGGEVVLAAGETRDVGDVVVPLAGGIEGLLLDADGEPLGGTKVAVVSLSGHRAFLAGDDGEGWTTLSDRQGRFLFSTLPPGSWELSAEPGARELVETAAGETQQVVLRCRRPPRVAGRITAGGRPLADVRAAFDERDATGGVLWGNELQRRRTSTDADGRYELSLFGPGPHWVHFDVPDGPDVGHEIDAAWDATIVLDHDFGTARVAGLVRSAADGRALGGARVWFHGEPADGSTSQSETVSTGDDGRFSLEHLTAGAWTVTAIAAGHARTALGPLELVAGEAREVEIAVPVGAELLVHLPPPPEGFAFVLGVTEPDGGPPVTFSSSEPPVQLTNLRPGPGSLQVSLWAEDGEDSVPLVTVPLDLRVGAQEIEVTLPAGG